MLIAVRSLGTYVIGCPELDEYRTCVMEVAEEFGLSFGCPANKELYASPDEIPLHISLVGNVDSVELIGTKLGVSFRRNEAIPETDIKDYPESYIGDRTIAFERAGGITDAFTFPIKLWDTTSSRQPEDKE